MNTREFYAIKTLRAAVYFRGGKVLGFYWLTGLLLRY